MNCNMMFKKWEEAYLFLMYIAVCFMICCVKVSAGEMDELPVSDILILYSDGISEEDKTNVIRLVEELTYQSFHVTFAPVSECVGSLDEFSYILCYKIERFPEALIGELYQREVEGNSSGENHIRIMFIGNEFLRAYLNQTGREGEYIYSTSKVGKIEYAFGGQKRMKSLVKEDGFLFLTEELDYSAGSLSVDGITGYFCGKKEVLYHIPVSDVTENMIRAAVSKEISLWKWPYNGEPHAYAQYMVFNKVYPFQDPDKILAIINYMIALKQPFAITVMPVYNNGNYPAMEHFCEVLRYAQANGGVILLHSPINQMADFDVELVNDYLTIAVSTYMEYGVYPMGLQVPGNWMLHSDTIEIMSRFRTVMVENEMDPLIRQEQDIHTNMVYQDGHQWIAPAITLDGTGTSYLKTYSTAVYFDISEDMEAIESKVQACISSEVPLKSLWDIEHSFWTDEDLMHYKNHIITINGKPVDQKFIATEYDENFKYNRNMLKRFSKDLSSGNRKLIVAVIIVATIFLAFIVVARYRNKQRFLMKDDS